MLETNVLANNSRNIALNKVGKTIFRNLGVACHLIRVVISVQYMQTLTIEPPSTNRRKNIVANGSVAHRYNVG